MYRHILIATDGSECSDKAVSQGLELAKASGAEVTVVTVTEPFASLGDREHMFEDMPDEFRRQAVDYLFESARVTLRKAEDYAGHLGIRCHTLHIEQDQPFEAIDKTAEQEGCDLIVVGSHGRRGMSRLLVGSEAMRVLTHTKIPVLVCR